jgi:hypothetical protein
LDRVCPTVWVDTGRSSFLWIDEGDNNILFDKVDLDDYVSSMGSEEENGEMRLMVNFLNNIMN